MTLEMLEHNLEMRNCNKIVIKKQGNKTTLTGTFKAINQRFMVSSESIKDSASYEDLYYKFIALANKHCPHATTAKFSGGDTSW